MGAVGVYCVVMTTSCAIRTHSVTITTHKAAGVFQPNNQREETFKNKQIDQREEADGGKNYNSGETESSKSPETGSGGHMRQHSMHKLDTGKLSPKLDPTCLAETSSGSKTELQYRVIA